MSDVRQPPTASPPSTLRQTPITLTVALALMTGGILLSFVVVLGVNDLTGALTRTRVFVNVNGEANLPAWWNGTLLLMVALGALACRSLTQRPAAARRAWLAVAVVALIMSLDEIASLHERLAEPVRAAGISLQTYQWLVPGVLIAAALAGLLLWVGRSLPPQTRWPLLLAMICFGAGALGVEAVNGVLRDADRSFYYLVGTTVEETIEMGACILAVAVIADHLCRQLDLRIYSPVPEELATP